MKKIIYTMLTAILLLCGAHSYAAIGDTAGNYYYTDIKTYLYYSPITSYNIGGKTVIDAEILNWHYGFDVYWHDDTRVLEILDKGGMFNSLEAMSGSLCEGTEGTTGGVAGSYYSTDIIATVDGREIESYNIGGRTCIAAEQLRDFGYEVIWDASARTLTIKKPSDFYKIETDYGMIATDQNYFAHRSFGTWTQGVSFSDGADTVTAPVICMASSVSYMKLQELCGILGAECTLEVTAKTGRTEWINGISYDENYNEYNFIINCDSPKYNSYTDFQTVGDFAPLEKDCYEINANVYATVNGEKVLFSSLASGRNGIQAFNAGIYIIDSTVYVPTYFASLLTGGEYLQS